MASSKFGRKLYPYRSLREPLGVKGVRQSVVITNNPSSIDQNQQLLVRFPNLGKDDVIVPGTARLAFAFNSEDANRTMVQNLGRAIVKKLTIKISGNEVMSIDDSDVFHCYKDLWKTAPERANGRYQGIDASDNRNTTRIRVGAGNGDPSVVADKAIADAFADRFFSPLDFELLSRSLTWPAAEPPTSKIAAEVADGLARIYKRSPLRWPKLLQVDHGREFMDSVSQQLVKHSVQVRCGRVDIHRDQGIVERFYWTLTERLFGHQYAQEMRLPSTFPSYSYPPQRSTEWVKRLPSCRSSEWKSEPAN